MSDKNNSTYSFLPAIGILLIAALTLFLTLQSPDTHRNDTPAPSNWQEQWNQERSLNLARRALAAVAVNGYLYAIGGVDEQGNYVRETEFARILADGSLTPWRTTSSLNRGRFYLAAVNVNDYIFAIGGGSGALGDDNQPVATVERARIQSDGSLGAWEIVTSMQSPRRGLKAVATQSHIYAIGGYNGVFLKNTEYAAISSTGLLGDWRIDPHESHLDRYIHSAALHDRFIYVLGGHVQKALSLGYGDVEMTEIQNDGSLSPWSSQASRLLVPRFIASAFAKDAFLYILAGHNGAQRLNSVEYAAIAPNGHVGVWQMTAPLNMPRSAAAVATYGDYVYVLGGIGDRQILSSVEMARQLPSGQLGQLLP